MSEADPQTPQDVPNMRINDRIDFVVDPDAEPGDVVGALARLLIDLAQTRNSEE